MMLKGFIFCSKLSGLEKIGSELVEIKKYVTLKDG